VGEVELMNCCMVYDREGDRVLVLDRIKGWKGIAFPGGHVEPGESIEQSTVREIKEETGLDICNVQPCGIIHWYDDDSGHRELIFCFKSSEYSGELVQQTDEGRVFWVHREELPGLKLANAFDQQLRLFFDDGVFEGYFYWNKAGENKLDWF
jgi:8-oxo-dGTP diphosphatase